MQEMKGKKVEINSSRLKENLHELGKIGRSPLGGINRSLASNADIESRKWIRKYWENILGLSVDIDPIANLWGRGINSESKKNPIVIGSHNDSVPEGGMYDGALGVLVATEVAQVIYENHIELQHPLELLSLTGEEPNPYQLSTVGSKALTGILTNRTIKNYQHIGTNEPLGNAIKRLGGDPSEINRAQLKPNELAGFLECHIEQGRRLFDAEKPVAIVKDITGIYRELVSIRGESNHAGTTVLRDRKDALLAASTVDIKLHEILEEFNDDALVGTIGYLKVSPNAANIIPGEVEFNIDIRSAEKKQIQAVVSKLDTVFDRLKGLGFIIDRETILDQPSVGMDKRVISYFDEIMENETGEVINLTSMAGHDAANIAHYTPTGMIFIASVDGKSHCKEEYSTIDDITVGANIMLKTVLKLDKELD